MSRVEPKVSRRSLLIPTEHGGWSFTLEPALLGLIVAPSMAGVLLALMGLIGFMARTPLRVSLVDRFRGRRLPRTRLADRITLAYVLALLVLLVAAALNAARPFWWPMLAAAPLVLIELWYDARSRSRRAAAELLGTVGVGAIGSMIVLAGGGSIAQAVGVWLIVAARAIAAVMFVRVQIRRVRMQPHRLISSDLAQAAAVLIAVAGVALDLVPEVAAFAILGIATVHVALSRWSVPKVGVIGAQQIVIGLTMVLAAGLAFAAPT
jgi:hypothetical protein